MQKALIILALFAIALGTMWTAYESHIANIGVMAWQHEFDQIRQGAPDSPPPSQPDNTPPQHNL